MLIAASAAGGVLLLWCVYAVIPTCYYKYWHDNHWQAQSSKKVLLLTFDDGPDERYTPRLLAILRQNGIKAIFFLPGFKAARHPELVRQIVEQGHQIGFHGYWHRNPWRLGFFATRRDFRQGMALWHSLGINSVFYRPPHGNITLANWFYARKFSLRPLLWTAIIGDWRNIGKDEIVSRLEKKVGDGAVICLHDSGQDTGGEEGAPLGTLAAVEKFIPLALSKGYEWEKQQ